MDVYDHIVEDDGAPALVLAGATIVDSNTRSGNPSHEISTGRFGVGGRKKKPVQPTGPSPSEIRRQDAIKDAARTLSDLSPDGVAEFVRKRWLGTKILTQADIDLFASEARRQRIEDITDALDHRIRKGVLGRNGSKVVKVDFPRGQIRGSLRGMTDNEVNSVLTRLRARGWTVADIKKHVLGTYGLRDRNVSTGLADDVDPIDLSLD